MTVKQVANSSGWRSSSKSETAQECMTSCAVQSKYHVEKKYGVSWSSLMKPQHLLIALYM